MENVSTFSNLRLFAEAVRRGLISWHESRKLDVTHRAFGCGQITNTEPGHPSQRIYIWFRDPHYGQKIIHEDAFLNGIITDMILPLDLVSSLRIGIEQEIAAQQQRELEELAREQPVRKIAARAEIGMELVRKNQWLYKILLNLTNNGDLTDPEITKLREKGFVAIVAVYYEILCQRSHKRGYLVLQRRFVPELPG